MLNSPIYRPFHVSELMPSGWMRRQLEIQANGLGGHLHEIWPDIRDSKWIGGDREGWERVPYWLDGFLPLAYLLHSEKLISVGQRYVDEILRRQCDDGWICPCTLEERPRYDMWASFLILKVLVQYADLSGDERIEPAVHKALKCLLSHMEKNTLFNWAASRWFECLIPIFWLYDRTGEAWLLDLARKLDVQGIDYEKMIAGFSAAEPKRDWTYLSHVVNLAMALKSRCLMSRLTGENPDEFAKKMLDKLTAFHGNALGYFSGDECLSGTSPVQGTELCGVVEAMFSYENLFRISGNPLWGDKMEMLAFNALPAALNEDMTARQYVQMSNQVQAAPLLEDHVIFRTNGPEAHVFGLETNFGCCTANFHQGWPKFAFSTLLRAEDGIVAASLVPYLLKTKLESVPVTAEILGAYPFRDAVEVRIDAEKPVEFTLYLRIPGTCTAATVDGVKAEPGTLVRLRRTWSRGSTVQVFLEQTPHTVQRPGGMLCVQRGPLLFAVPIGARMEIKEYEKDGVPRKYPYCDRYLYPDTPWNYGFTGEPYKTREYPISDVPFSRSNPPLTLEALMACIPWRMEYGVCMEEPDSRIPQKTPETIQLYPYGCTDLRMTEVPLLNESSRP